MFPIDQQALPRRNHQGRNGQDLELARTVVGAFFLADDLASPFAAQPASDRHPKSTNAALAEDSRAPTHSAAWESIRSFMVRLYFFRAAPVRQSDCFCSG